jgi:hypothetical protein
MGKGYAKHHKSTIMRNMRHDEISDAAMKRMMTLSNQLTHQLNPIHKQQNPPEDEKATDGVKRALRVGGVFGRSRRGHERADRPSEQLRETGRALD